jgi:trehalose/maltose transport system substrate-binding protein
VNAVARPSDVTGARYNQVSTEFRNAAHNTLNGSMSADRALSQLERKLERQARSWR